MSEHEAKCRKCGKCCYYKTLVETPIGMVGVISDRHCVHLDPETGLCKQYERRHELGVGCLDTDKAIRLRALPADCPYVKGIKGYVGPITQEDLERLLNGSK